MGVRNTVYLIDGAGVSVKQHAERILENRTGLGLGERVLFTFHGLPQKGLGDVSAVAGRESRGRVGDAEQVHISQEPDSISIGRRERVKPGMEKRNARGDVWLTSSRL